MVEAENAVLRERVEQLERLLADHYAPPVEWRLTQHEARVFGVLRARELATKDAILAGLYGHLAGDAPEAKIVDVFICKLRKKLQPFGIVIETIWGQGYRLAAESRARVAA